jgi:hypothetical protein
MKLIKELHALTESVMPKLILVHMVDGDYDGCSAIMSKFGFKDQGSAEDFNVTEEDTEGYMPEEFSVWAPTRPTDQQVKDMVSSGDVIALGL